MKPVFQVIRRATGAGAFSAPVAVDHYVGADSVPADARIRMTKAAADCLEFSWDWYRLLEQTVLSKSGNRAYFHVLRVAGVPAVILPLAAPANTLGQSATALGNFYTTLYAPYLAPEVTVEQLTLLLRHVKRVAGGRPSLRLAPMDRQAPGYALLRRALRRAGFVSFEFFCFGNWYLRPAADWDEYLCSRDAKLRYAIRKMGERLTAKGARIEILTTREEVATATSAYERVYAASWKRAEPFEAFIPGLIELCAAQGALRMGIIWLGERPIAAQLWILTGKRISIYKVAYDEEFKSFSPGTVLTATLMRHALQNDSVHEVDYLMGDDPYKRNWMTDRRERWGLIAFNPMTIRGSAALALESFNRLGRSCLQRLDTLKGRFLNASDREGLR